MIRKLAFLCTPLLILAPTLKTVVPQAPEYSNIQRAVVVVVVVIAAAAAAGVIVGSTYFNTGTHSTQQFEPQ